jgi:hypothetical protein
MTSPELPREEVAAALGARRELGQEMEPAVVEAFAERVERAIDARVDARLAGRGAAPAPGRRGGERRHDLALPIVSLGVAIPLTAIAADAGGFLAVLVVWIGLVAINVAHARRRA